MHIFENWDVSWHILGIYRIKCKKKTIDTITKFVMILLVIMGLVLVLLETVMDSVGLYW